jgi:hypothetical protein
MATPPTRPRTPPGRWIGLLLSRRFWVIIGVVIVAALAVYALVAIPVGPTSFAFSFGSSSCGCQHTASSNHTFPDDAHVTLRFTSRYIPNPTGNASEYVLIVRNPAGQEIVYANMVGGTYGAIGTANTTAMFTTSAGGTFEFTLLGAYPTVLPPITAWVNGTYRAPILS